MVQGKHSKSIECGAWSTDNKLALGGRDKQITLSDSEGSGLAQVSLKGEPSQMRYVVRRDQGREEPTISTILDSKTVFLCVILTGSAHLVQVPADSTECTNRACVPTALWHVDHSPLVWRQQLVSWIQQWVLGGDVYIFRFDRGRATMLPAIQHID